MYEKKSKRRACVALLFDAFVRVDCVGESLKMNAFWLRIDGFTAFALFLHDVIDGLGRFFGLLLRRRWRRLLFGLFLPIGAH